MRSVRLLLYKPVEGSLEEVITKAWISNYREMYLV